MGLRMMQCSISYCVMLLLSLIEPNRTKSNQIEPNRIEIELHREKPDPG